nr:VITF-3 45 kDA large subunit [Wadden Sea poxvirus]
MDDIFTFLHEIENKYTRTIFNFHLINYNNNNNDNDIGDIYACMKNKISSEDIFNNVVITPEIRSEIKKLVYCDIHLTKHIINHNCYPIYSSFGYNVQFKCSQFFDINAKPDILSTRTVEIFERDKSSLVSYIKTTNKKHKIDYGEIKKTVHGFTSSFNYFSGKRSDDYLMTTIKSNTLQPWIKTISKRMRVDIINDSIITKGKSSILQTIEIVFNNRTCIKIFKDSTMHIILSKDKSENGCLGMIDKLFSVYNILFSLLNDITNNNSFINKIKMSKSIILAKNFDSKISIIKSMKNEYGIHNFRIGMFNLTLIKPINHTVFPSLLCNNSKIKFFKGKKLNIVALRSLEDCKKYIKLSEIIMNNMLERSNILDNINIESESIEKLKELLI